MINVKLLGCENIQNSKLLHAPYSLCLKWVFGPVVFGISASQFLAHFKVCSLPEAFEVLRQLYRFESGRQQFHKQRLLSVVYAWRAFHSEAFLQTYAQHRSLGSLSVVYANVRSCRHGYVSRRDAVYFLLRFVWNRVLQNFCEVKFLQFGSSRLYVSSLVKIQRQPILGIGYHVAG